MHKPPLAFQIVLLISTMQGTKSQLSACSIRIPASSSGCSDQQLVLGIAGGVGLDNTGPDNQESLSWRPRMLGWFALPLVLWLAVLERHILRRRPSSLGSSQTWRKQPTSQDAILPCVMLKGSRYASIIDSEIEKRKRFPNTDVTCRIILQVGVHTKPRTIPSGGNTKVRLGCGPEELGRGYSFPARPTLQPFTARPSSGKRRQLYQRTS